MSKHAHDFFQRARGANAPLKGICVQVAQLLKLHQNHLRKTKIYIFGRGVRNCFPSF